MTTGSLIACVKASAQPKMTNVGWIMLHAAEKIEAPQQTVRGGQSK
jgi:hypothetical protein